MLYSPNSPLWLRPLVGACFPPTRVCCREMGGRGENNLNFKLIKKNSHFVIKKIEDGGCCFAFCNGCFTFKTEQFNGVYNINLGKVRFTVIVVYFMLCILHNLKYCDERPIFTDVTVGTFRVPKNASGS